MTRNSIPLKQQLQTRILVGDGAMGTLLYEQGIPLGICYEELNLSQPHVISDIHKRHLMAGAQVFETNTFGANRFKLANFGLDDRVKSINQEAVRIARSVVGSDNYVLGAICSIRGGRHELQPQELRSYYEEQLEALLEAEVDGILFETFMEYGEMILAVEIARKLDKEITVLSQFAVNSEGRTQDGVAINAAFTELTARGADVVGFNCRSGPSGMLRNLQQVTGDYCLSAFPNAGLPDYVDGQYIYPSSVDYFAQLGVQMAAKGVRLLGGCCGTTPDHIKALTAALDQYRLTQLPPAGEPAETIHDTNRPDTLPAKEKLAAPLPAREQIWVRSLEGSYSLTLPQRVAQDYSVIVELDPPRNLQIDRFLAGAHALKQAGAAAISMAENSLASTRVSNMPLAYLVQEQAGITAIPHMTCRDRNLIAQQSHLMGLHTLGINHLLAVTGDPTSFADTPGASSVYDLNSFEMIRMIKQFNEGRSYTGRDLKGSTNFTIACALNPNVKHLEPTIKRLEKKIQNGAQFVMTQPINDLHLFAALKEATAHLNIPIFVGIAPLVSYKNALFGHNEIPGYRIPQNVLDRMSKFEGEDAVKEGMEIARELITEAVRHFAGIFLITPYLRYEMTAELTVFAKQITAQAGIA
ncbi:MAG: homocysteine methyltransferase [Bacilli bacterium]|nr:homocysteine methyltransferase [Bacilli bacterium]